MVFLERVAPFGSFLREFYIALWDLGLIPGQGKDLNGDLKAWGRTCPNNDTKAKALVELVERIEELVVLIDDVSGLTPTSRPHLERLTEATMVVATVSPQALKKSGTKRFWKRFLELALERLNKPMWSVRDPILARDHLP